MCICEHLISNILSKRQLEYDLIPLDFKIPPNLLIPFRGRQGVFVYLLKIFVFVKWKVLSTSEHVRIVHCDKNRICRNKFCYLPQMLITYLAVRSFWVVLWLYSEFGTKCVLSAGLLCQIHTSPRSHYTVLRSHHRNEKETSLCKTCWDFFFFLMFIDFVFEISPYSFKMILM